MKLHRLAVTACVAAIAAATATPAFAGDVRGFVVDATETVALRAARVTIEELGRTATAERDGSFYFADVPAGTYTVVASYVGAQPVRRTVTVPQTGAVDVDFLLGGDNANEILVVGQSATQASALSRKRANDVVSDVLTRDAIGQFPDQNVAESLRRLPGVNVLNDQGEGRFVSVRGLSPTLNATSVNGVRLPAPESDTRAVALDVISSDIIESIEVKKSLTPDMDADTIGASIEIETTSAFDRQRSLVTAKVEGSYNHKADTLTPRASFDFSTRVTDDFGVSGGISYYLREFATDNIEADDWVENGGSPFATEVQFRDYDVERERISANLGFDIRASDTTELYVRGLWSQFDDQEYRRRLTFDLGDFDGGASSQNGRQFTFSDADEEFTVERDVKDRFERQRIRTLVAGGETDTGDWFAKYAGSYAIASEKENGSLDPTTFERDFDGDGLTVGLDFSDERRPAYSVSGATGLFFDPSEYELNDIEVTALSDSQDEEWGAQLDIGRRFQMAGSTFTVQAGGKGRWREKTYDADIEFYEYVGPGDFTLADVLGTATYDLQDIAPLADGRSPRSFFNRNRGDFELQTVDTQFDSAAEDFAVDEDILAGYLLGRFETDRLTVIGGVRYEDTSNVLRGNDVLLVEEDGTLPDGTIAGDDTVIVSPISIDKNYSHWLPSLNVRYELAPDLIARLAGYRSIVRPTPFEQAPHFAVEEADDGEREGTFGNPDLEPTEAWNLDATLEYYMSSNGALTAGVFYKDLNNFIVEVNTDVPGIFRGLAFDEASIFQNGDSADVFGVELGFAQSFRNLPAPLDGLLLQANYTYTDADGTVTTLASAGPRSIPLPAASKHTANLVLGYEKGPLSIRVAGTYRDKYLDELADIPALDRYVDDHFQVDMSAKLEVFEGIRLYFEWVNINNAKYFAYNRLGGQRNLYQYEEYDYTMKFGVRFSF